MAVKVNEVTQSTSNKGNNKLFLNILINVGGKRLKLAATTLDWVLANGTNDQKRFIKKLIEKHNEKGTMVQIKNVDLTFVQIDEENQGISDEDMDDVLS